MTSDKRIFLHQYDSSPFSEKIRVCFGIKNLSWHAVDQPVIMPKPELTLLTGGYRRIPVLQIGADLYCDSQLIARELERRFPKPSLLAGDDRALSFGLGMWTDRSFFQSAVTVIFGGNTGVVDEAFKKDREALTGRPFDTEAMARAAPMMAEQLRAHAAILSDQLSDGRDFLLGASPGLVDANAYYNLWFVRSFYPDGAKVFDDLPELSGWQERVREIGHGGPTNGNTARSNRSSAQRHTDCCHRRVFGRAQRTFSRCDHQGHGRRLWSRSDRGRAGVVKSA